jgi:hypothetical protein
MDRLARHDPSVKTGDLTDNIVVLQEEKSFTNQDTPIINLVFSHKPAAEVFKNPALLAAAKLARTEIKQQLIATGRATNSKAEKILDNIKYNSVSLDRKGYGKDVEKVVGSTSFHLMAQVLKINTEKFRIEDTPKTLNASASKPRAKRGTGVFQPAVTCPDIFEPVGFRDNGSSHLRSSDEASEIYGRADRTNISRGG